MLTEHDITVLREALDLALRTHGLKAAFVVVAVDQKLQAMLKDVQAAPQEAG